MKNSLYSNCLDGLGRVSVRNVLAWGVEVLKEVSISDPVAEAEYLLSSIIGCSRPQLRLIRGKSLSRELLALTEHAFRRRLKREPSQYIIGREEFMGLCFSVTRDVFIPRPETELLVEDAVGKIGNDCVNIFDIGTGTGCIAIAIALFCPNARCYAVDISSNALEIARENAGYYNLSGRVDFFQGDLFEPFAEIEGVDGADIIISNPPYLSEEDIRTVQPEVKFFEPHEALYGGRDGLFFYGRIIEQAPSFLKKDGRVILETGYRQCVSVMKLFEESGFRWNLSRTMDYSGIYRLISAQII